MRSGTPSGLPPYPSPEQARIPLALVDDTPDESNPNAMTEAEFAALCDAVTVEFGQDVTLERRGERLAIVDGVHRCRAARLAGMKEVPALVYPPLSEAQFKWLRLSLNKHRGDPNPTAVHEDVRALAELGVGREAIEVAAPLLPEEIDALLGVRDEPPPAAGGGAELPDVPEPTAGTASSPAPGEGRDEAPTLEVPCASRESLAELRALLKRAGRGVGTRGKYRLEATLRKVLQEALGEA